MLCLLIAHGIFLRQEASQSRACHLEESPTCKDPKTHLVHARSVPVRYSRLAPALSRVCEAVAHRRRVRLKLRLRRSARTCTVPPGQLVSFLTTTTARAVDCLISLISHSGPHLPLVIHTSTALHHHSLWCFATILPFIVPGPAVTLSGTLRLLTYHSLSPATSTLPTRRRPSFYHRLLLVSSHTIPFTSPPGCWTPVLDTALISSLPTISSSSRLSFGPNYRCSAHS